MSMDKCNRERKAKITIWCKIYTNNFSEEMVNKTATGQEIYDFLMQDAGCCYDDNNNVIPGDCNLWYLGCNEKFGELKYKDNSWTWGFGKSSFLHVMMFVSAIYVDGLFTCEQYETLISKIEEGQRIGDMYRINDYLICRKRGMAWT